MSKLEWNWLRWDFFTAFEDDDKFAIVMCVILGGIMGSCMGLVLSMILESLFLSVAAALWFIPLFAFVGITAPFWGRLHVLSGFPDNDCGRYSGRTALDYAKRYYALPESDRPEIPLSAVNLLKEPALSEVQRGELKTALDRSLDEAERRLKYKANLDAKRVDISDMLHELELGRKRLRSDNKTYAEYL